MPKDSPKPANLLELGDLVDQYAVARQRMKSWEPNVNPHVERFEELEEEIFSRAQSVEAEKSIIWPGNRFTLPISARRKVRSLLAGALPKLFSKWNKTVFLEACTVSLTTIDKLVAVKDRGKYVSEKYSGPRIIGEPVVKQEGAPQ